MAELNVGKITQIISAVLDIKFSQGKLPEINEAIKIATQDGGTLVAEVSQHLGDDTVRHGQHRRSGSRHGGRGNRSTDFRAGW